MATAGCRALLWLSTCGMHFAHLSLPVGVSPICLVEVVCMCGVASVHAACAQVDVIKASDGLPLEHSWPGARYNPCDLLVVLPPSHLLCIVLQHLRSPGASSLPGVSLIPAETHMLKQTHTEP